jgi:cell division protein FtsB
MISGMVVRYRIRAVLIPLALYLVSGLTVGYFVYHSQHGDRGLETKLVLRQQILALDEELAGLKEEKTDWERRVSMLRTSALDRDLLEERARLTLNRMHRNDVVIMTGEGAAAMR